MSLYSLQKLIREINRNPSVRGRFMEAPAIVAAEWTLTDEERLALVQRDFGALYRLGVHGLLLRPFSIIHQVSEPDYLRSIREEQE